MNKRALIITNYFYPAIGGAENQALAYGKGLIAKGYQVSVLTEQFDNSLKRSENLKNLRVSRVADNFWQILIFLFRNRGFNLVLWNGPWKKTNQSFFKVFLWVLISRMLNRKIYFRICRNTNFINFLPVFTLLYRSVVNGWLALNQSQEASLKTIGVNKNKIISPPNNIIDTKLFRPKNDKLKSNQKKIKIAYCSRLVKGKGLEQLVGVAKAIANNSDVEFQLFVSISPKYPQQAVDSLRLLNELPQTAKLNFQRTDPQNLYKNCEIGLLTSSEEGASNVLLEMMASGLAVIASDIPGYSQFIRNEQNGLLFEPGSINSLLEKLNYLLTNRKMIPYYGRKARQTTTKIGNANTIVSKIVA